jgi:hypothetical protein
MRRSCARAYRRGMFDMALLVGGAYLLTRPGVIDAVSEIAKDKEGRDAMINIAFDILKMRAIV